MDVQKIDISLGKFNFYWGRIKQIEEQTKGKFSNNFL